MEEVKVSSKGQIVIPKSLRDAHHIRTGDRFVVSSVGHELRFRPAPTLAKTRLKSVAGMLHRPGLTKLSATELERRLAEQLLAEDAATQSQ